MRGNNILYSGYAKVHYYKGGELIKTQRIKNKGTSLLFQLLAQCLCGYNVGNLMPQYIDVGHINGGSFNSLLSNRVNVKPSFIRGYQDVDSKGEVVVRDFAAVFKGFIPSTTLLLGDTTKNISVLRLYNSYNNKDAESLLAEITLKDKEVVDVTTLSGYSLMIEWVMSFSNTNDSTSSGSSN